MQVRPVTLSDLFAGVNPSVCLTRRIPLLRYIPPPSSIVSSLACRGSLSCSPVRRGAAPSFVLCCQPCTDGSSSSGGGGGGGGGGVSANGRRRRRWRPAPGDPYTPGSSDRIGSPRPTSHHAPYCTHCAAALQWTRVSSRGELCNSRAADQEGDLRCYQICLFVLMCCLFSLVMV